MSYVGAGVACLVVGILLVYLTVGILHTLGFALCVIGIVLLIVGLFLYLGARTRAP